MTQANDRGQALTTIVALGLLALGVWRATSLAWLCDDSFISIRYAENLVNGIGLVYNAGEFVEGYTNLLWTLLLALFARFGVSPVTAAQYLGIVFYAALAVVLGTWSRRRSKSAAIPFLPLAAGLCLVSVDFHEWATGGLETMLFTLLATGGILLTRWPGGSRAHALGAGVALALLVLTRLDGLLFVVAGVASYWYPKARMTTGERRVRALAVAAPVAATLAVLLSWKLAYYGELLPTAFYSKSVLRPYFSQGILYVALFLVKNWFLPVAGAALVVTAIAAPRGRRADADAGFLLGTAALYLAYVVEVGGDFMFARRVIPVVPLVLVAIESRVAVVAGARVRAALAAAAVAAAALPLPLYDADSPVIAGIADERRVYPAEKLARRELQGRTLAAALADSDVRVGFEGGMCVFGYYSRLPYLAELTGLTQYSLAKRPLTRRGQVGHEKVPDADWFAENRIHLLIRRDLPPLERPVDPDLVDEIRFGDVARATILLYSDAVMDPLRDRPDVTFVPIETVIDRAARRMQPLSPADAQKVFDQLRRWYFDSAGEGGERHAERLRAILAQKRRDAGGF